MQQRELALCLKVLDVVIVAGCLWFIAWYLPHGGFAHMAGTLPFEPAEVWPIRTALLSLVAAVPVIGIGVLCWLIFADIGRDQSFTMRNAARLRRVSILALIEAVIFIVIAAICSFVQVLVFGLFALLLICIVASFTLAIVAAALSHLTLKASVIQDENDLTV